MASEYAEFEEGADQPEIIACLRGAVHSAWPDIDEPLDASQLEEALATDRDDRSLEDWDLVELAAEKWLDANSPQPGETLDIQAQAERPPSLMDNFSDVKVLSPPHKSKSNRHSAIQT